LPAPHDEVAIEASQSDATISRAEVEKAAINPWLVETTFAPRRGAWNLKEIALNA
jgi:hypothetical protein